jgi:hypothetical protein
MRSLRLALNTFLTSPWKTAADEGIKEGKLFTTDMLQPFLVISLVIGLFITLYYWYQDGQSDNANFKKYLLGVVFIVIGIGVVSSAHLWLWNFL